MSKNTKFQSLVVDAITSITHNQNDVLTARARHRNQLLQDVSSDIQVIVTESNLSVEEAINEWLFIDGYASKNILHRRWFAEHAIQKFPIAINS